MGLINRASCLEMGPQSYVNQFKRDCIKNFTLATGLASYKEKLKGIYVNLKQKYDDQAKALKVVVSKRKAVKKSRDKHNDREVELLLENEKLQMEMAKLEEMMAPETEGRKKLEEEVVRHGQFQKRE